MRSQVVKRLPHLRHSRRRRIDSASLLSRESTTLSSRKPQKGHFIALVSQWESCAFAEGIVTGGARGPRPGEQAPLSEEGRSCSGGPRLGFLFGPLAFGRKLAEGEPLAMRQPQTNGHHGDEGDQPEHDPAAGRQLGGTPKIRFRASMVANCDPPPTPGSWTSEPTMLEAISKKTWVCGMRSLQTSDSAASLQADP